MSKLVRESRLKPGSTVKGEQTYTLGAMLAQGGEGQIYRLDRIAGRVAKIYLHLPGEAQSTKLNRMLKMRKASLSNIAAWPDELLYVGSDLVGFIMPEISGARPIHTLITPGDRLRLSPNASFSTLVLVASNIARAVTTFHQAGVIIGDINGSNVLVLPDQSVRIIDCDSCQVGPEKAMRCPVGMEEFLAPELQGRKLAKIKRNRNHDAFPLAVMIYELLCMGRHPFAGNDAIGLGQAIKRRRHTLRGWLGPRTLKVIGLPPHVFLPAPIVKLFRRAFGASRWRSRPSALEWMNALDDLHARLVRCEYNPAHAYSETALWCPWCTLEQRGRLSFFPPTPANRRRPWRPESSHAFNQRIRYAYAYVCNPAKQGL